MPRREGCEASPGAESRTLNQNSSQQASLWLTAHLAACLWFAWMLDFHQKTPFTCIQACCVWLLDPTAASSHRSPCVASGEEQRVPEGLTAKQRARRGRSRERGAERGGLVAKINRKMVKYSTARAAPILRRQTVKPRGRKALKRPAPPAARP